MILFSCSPQKRVARIYAHHPEARPIDSDSIETWISYTCDSFPVYTPYEELSFDTAGIVPEGIIFHHSEKKGRLSQTVDIVGGHVTFKCAEDSLREVIRFQNKLIQTKDSRKQLIPQPIRDGWYQFWKYLAIVSVSLLLIIVILLILRLQ